MKNNRQGYIAVKILIILAVVAAAFSHMSAKTRRHNQIQNLMFQVSSLGAQVSQYHNRLDEIVNTYHRDYALFLSKTANFLPIGLSYQNNIIQADYNAIIKANIDDNNVVIFEVSNIDAEACIKIATTNFGTLQTTRFVGIGIGVKPNFSCLAAKSCKFDYVSSFSSTPDYPFSLDRATYPCSLFSKTKEPATVYLGYQL